MSNAFDVKIVSLALSADAAAGTGGWEGNDVVGHVLRAPLAGQGGAITILRAYAVNAAATNGSTGFALQLENWGTAGTAILAGSAGTVAAALGGTADPWAVDTPKAFTLSNPTLDAGEWLVLRKTETNSSDPTRGVLVIEYVAGS